MYTNNFLPTDIGTEFHGTQKNDWYSKKMSFRSNFNAVKIYVGQKSLPTDAEIEFHGTQNYLATNIFSLDNSLYAKYLLKLSVV
jgi:hypothetical protein